jgi:hypothetical protein
MEQVQTSMITANSTVAWRDAGKEQVRTVRDSHAKRKWPVSLATTVVVAVACLLSIAAYVHFYPGGETIAYADARSHLLIARRVLFADTPGAGQLGSVWLPLPHLLMIPFVWNTWAFYSGFAGSVVMMASYVVCTLFVYKFTWRLTGQHIAAAAAAAAFALNPNMLYMQSTPMTELLMFVTMMGAVYGLLCWVQTDESNRFHSLYLLGAGLSALLCALTRYEGWTMGVALTAVVLYCSVAKQGVRPLRQLLTRERRHLTEGQVLGFGILGATGPIVWMIWNWVLLGNPFDFQDGTFAKPSNWVGNGELAMHHLWISLRTYQIAATDTISAPIAVLAVLGLAVYLWRTRLSAESMPALALLVMFPMFVYFLYKGQRPLHVYQYYHSFYNVRFGLVMLLPACLMVGYLVATLSQLVPARWRSLPAAFLRAAPAAAVIWCLAAIVGAALGTGNIVTLEEPLAFDAAPSFVQATQAASWLRQHYAGGLMLMESYGNEEVAFASHVPLQKQVYEGSYRIWAPSLAHPDFHGIAWVVMHDSTQDQVYTSLHASITTHGYRLAWSNGDYLIYKWGGTAAQLAANERL